MPTVYQWLGRSTPRTAKKSVRKIHDFKHRLAPGPLVTVAALKSRLPSYTWAEIEKHDNPDDAWIVLDDIVYCVDSWVAHHPGGAVLLSYAGRDATDVFSAMHAGKHRHLLSALAIGTVADPRPVPPLTQAYRKLTLAYEREGKFVFSRQYYICKAMEVLMLLIGALVLLWVAYSTAQSWLALAGAILLGGLFLQQQGWQAHDYCHRQVVTNPRGLALIKLCLGPLAQGFSTSWWHDKHTVHHAAPNIEHIDPDIDTMPILAWSDRLLEADLDPAALSDPAASAPSGVPWLVRHQALVFPLVLPIAQLNWGLQSLIHALSLSPGPKRTREVIGILLHHILWLTAGILLTRSLSGTLIWYFVPRLLAGIGLGLIFSLNHNGLETLPAEAIKSMSWFELQVRTARNITHTAFNDWISGGLSYQIEHHLWPRMPRHYLPSVAEDVKSLAASYNLPYKTQSIPTGLGEIFARLRKLQNHACALQARRSPTSPLPIPFPPPSSSSPRLLTTVLSILRVRSLFHRSSSPRSL